MTKVVFEVLVSKRGNVVKNATDYDWTLQGMRYWGFDVELREAVAESPDAAFFKACEMGANPKRTMRFSEFC